MEREQITLDRFRNLGTMRLCRGCSWVEDDLCSARAEKKEDGHDPR